VNHGVVALDANIGTHAHQLGCEHKTILEDVLGDNGAAVSQGGEHHDLSLHIRGETGERERLDIDRLDALGTVHMDAILDALAADAHELHLLEHHYPSEVGQKPVTSTPQSSAINAPATNKGTGLDTVRPPREWGNGMQLLHRPRWSRQAYRRRQSLATHLVKHVGEIDDLGRRGRRLSITVVPSRAHRRPMMRFSVAPTLANSSVTVVPCRPWGALALI